MKFNCFFFSILLFVLSNTLQGQVHTGIFPYQDSSVVYTEVVNQDSFSISDFYNNAKLFLVKSANQYNATIELEVNKIKNYIVKEDSTQIISNIRFVVQQAFGRSDYEALVTIDIKANRYRYTFTDFKMIYNSGAAMANGSGQQYVTLEQIDVRDGKTYLTKIDKAIKTQIDLLKKTMQTKGTDW